MNIIQMVAAFSIYAMEEINMVSFLFGMGLGFLGGCVFMGVWLVCEEGPRAKEDGLI